MSQKGQNTKCSFELSVIGSYHAPHPASVQIQKKYVRCAAVTTVENPIWIKTPQSNTLPSTIKPLDIAKRRKPLRSHFYGLLDSPKTALPKQQLNQAKRANPKLTNQVNPEFQKSVKSPLILLLSILDTLWCCGV